MLTALRTIFHHIKARHERRLAIRALSVMDDHQLSDIGIERGFVVDAVDGNLPQLLAWTRG
jgi:uncharacterized protein YjiS (DUF1127 family)